MIRLECPGHKGHFIHSLPLVHPWYILLYPSLLLLPWNEVCSLHDFCSTYSLRRFAVGAFKSCTSLETKQLDIIMDIPDVSAAKEYLEMLTKLKVGLQAASKRKGQVPTDRKPRAQVIKNQMENLMSSAFMEQMDLSRPERLLHSSFLPPPYLPSITSLKDLKKILIRDMQLETHHRGFYALLRAVTPSHRMTAVLTIVEDEKGDVTLLQLYQQEHEEVRSARDIFKPKGVCIVKEPYFKIASDGNYALRVDHVSDLVWLREEDDRVPECWRPQIIELDKSAGDWKQEGNTDFEAGNFHDAVEKYNAPCFTEVLLC